MTKKLLGLFAIWEIFWNRFEKGFNLVLELARNSKFWFGAFWLADFFLFFFSKLSCESILKWLAFFKPSNLKHPKTQLCLLIIFDSRIFKLSKFGSTEAVDNLVSISYGSYAMKTRGMLKNSNSICNSSKLRCYSIKSSKFCLIVLIDSVLIDMWVVRGSDVHLQICTVIPLRTYSSPLLCCDFCVGGAGNFVYLCTVSRSPDIEVLK